MDADTQRALNDLSNNFTAELQRITSAYNEVFEGMGEVIKALTSDLTAAKMELLYQGNAVKLMDEAYGYIATRLDAIEQIMQLETPPEPWATDKEKKP